MNTFQNRFNSLERLIFEEGLKIEAINFHRDLDLMLIILNSKAILRQKISSYPRLHNASQDDLNAFELIGNGVGIHWPQLDEDLSLKGFLQNELRKVVAKDFKAA